METREELIKRYWHNNRQGWPVDSQGRSLSEFCMAVEPDMRTPPKWMGDEVSAPIIDILRFRKEHGTFDGRPAVRIVCEGVVVDMAFLPQ